MAFEHVHILCKVFIVNQSSCFVGFNSPYEVLSLHVHAHYASLSVFFSHTNCVLRSSWAEGFGHEPATSAEADFPRLPQGYLSMIPIGP